MSGVSARILKDPDEWAAISADWDRLLQSLPGGSVLQSYRFLRGWWEHLGGDKNLYIVLAEIEDKPVGFIPLQRRVSTLWGRQYRTLEFIGMPDELLRPALVFPQDSGEALQAALEALWARKDEWDHVELEEVIVDEGVRREIDEIAADHRLLTRWQPFHACPLLDLRQDWAEYKAGLSSKLKKNLRYLNGKLRKQGVVRCDVNKSVSKVRRALQTFIEIEKRSWKPEAGIGVSRSSKYQCFYEALLTNYAETGQARVIILWLDDKPIAGTLSIQEDGHYYSLQIAHDQAFDRFSPGTLLEAMELEGLMNEKAFTTFEFFGGAMSNKRRWASMHDETERLLMRQRDVRTWLFDWVYFRLKPRIRAFLGKGD